MGSLDLSSIMINRKLKICLFLVCYFGPAYSQRQQSLLEKRRIKLKSVLHDYVENQERRLRQANTPTIECNDDLTLIGECNTPSGKDLYISNMFEAYKFRLNQVENNDQRYNRITKFWKVTTNKGLKKDEFTNSSLWLEAVVGGDVTNPVCNGVEETSFGQEIQALYTVLSQCPESIGSSCVVDYASAELTPEQLEDCKDANTVVKDKINDCRNDTVYDEQTRCPCLIDAVDVIDDFKKFDFNVETVNGTVEKNCMAALLDTQKLARTQYETCVDALIACKQSEDAAIEVINKCNNAASGLTTRRIVSSHRNLFDYDDEFMDDFEEIDYDY